MLACDGKYLNLLQQQITLTYYTSGIIRFVYNMYTGVWDVMSNVEVIDFVRQRIAQEMNLGEVRN